MLNTSTNSPQSQEEEQFSSLQNYFKQGVSPDDVEQLFLLKQAQPLLQVFTALFHGGSNGVMIRLLVLRELVSDVSSSTFTRSDINLKLAYLSEDSLETVLARFRTHQLLAWDAGQGIYRVTPLARNVLSAIDSLLLSSGEDEVDMGYLLSQVAGAQAIGGISADQLHHLLGRLIELTEEFRDAIASGSEFRLRTAQDKWHSACDWVEKGSSIIHSITANTRADASTHKVAQAIGRAQGALLNMQGMFSRALNQIERQRVHLGQSGLSTTDIKTWLMEQDDLAKLAEGAIAIPLKPSFITPAEMIDVAEAELLAERVVDVDSALPEGTDTPVFENEMTLHTPHLDAWLERLGEIINAPESGISAIQAVLPATFAIASYRASLLSLLSDESEAVLQGGTGAIARLPLTFTPLDVMELVDDEHLSAMSAGILSSNLKIQMDSKHE